MFMMLKKYILFYHLSSLLSLLRSIYYQTTKETKKTHSKKCVQFGHILKTCELITPTKSSFGIYHLNNL